MGCDFGKYSSSGQECLNSLAWYSDSVQQMNIESRGTVLHVEDEPMVRKAMVLLLTGDGYSVTSAASGPEAIHLIQEGLRPELLIMDFHLDEDMNGAEATEGIRRALGYALPVIMLTGNPSGAEIPWITDAPVWLARKPMNSQVLLAALPSLVQLSRATREIKTFPR